MTSRPRRAPRRRRRCSTLAWLGAAVVAVLVAVTGSASVAAEGVDPSGAAASAPPPGGARRIVSLAPSVTETLFALDRGDRLVGISTFCDYPKDEVAALPRAGSYLTPNVERIVSLRPDLVLGVPTPGNQAAVEQLRALGLRVVIVGELTLADTWSAMRTIGRWAGNEAGAEALVAKLEGEIAAVRADASRLPRRKVLFVVGHDPLVAAGSGLFIDELIAAAGGANVGASSGVSWPRLSLETVIAAAPDVIIDGAMGSEAHQGLEAYWRQFASVPAVRAGRLWPQRSDALLRPGPRVGLGARELFEMIHAGRNPSFGAPS
jgi:iron complex transport system substrate-binding protein